MGLNMVRLDEGSPAGPGLPARSLDVGTRSDSFAVSSAGSPFFPPVWRLPSTLRDARDFNSLVTDRRPVASRRRGGRRHGWAGGRRHDFHYTFNRAEISRAHTTRRTPDP